MLFKIVDKHSNNWRTGLTLPLIIGCAVLMQTMDSAVVATALPSMARSLGEDALRLNLVLTAYILGAAVFIPASGWLADRFGARRVFLAAISVFALTSLLCALAQDLMQLTLVRTVQGAASAMLLPVGRLVLLRTAPKDQLLQAISIVTIPALIGPVLGAPLGGLVVTLASWRWVFLINLPIAAVGLVLVRRFVPELKEDDAPPLDIVGLVLSGLALAGLVLGLSSLGGGGLPAPVLALLLGVSVLSGLAYLVHARGRAQPVLDLALFREREFRLTTVGALFARLPLGATPFLLALLLQVGFGMSALSAGLLTFVTAVGALIVRGVVGPILRRTGYRRLLMVNGLLSALTFAACAAFRPQTPHLAILAALLVHGFLRSLQMLALNTLVYADLNSRQMSGATTLQGVLQQVAQAFGIGLAAAAVQGAMFARGSATIEAADVYPAFIAIGAVSLVSIFFFARLPAGAGEALSGPTRRRSPPPSPPSPD